MQTLFDLFIQPFVEFDFMRRALVGVVCLGINAAPLGAFLVLRRMSLMGDALSHAILPGVALGYMAAGASPWAMGLGGLAAGLAMALGVGLASRLSILREDANFAAFYLGCLALGVVLVSRHASQTDLLHLLFGSILAVDDAALALITGVACITLLVLALAWRGLMLHMIDPLFLQARTGHGARWHVLLLMLVTLNLVAGFQALGTLMSVGLMMLPAIIARLWAARMGSLFVLAVALAWGCGYCGLLLSFHIEIPSGPAIILLCAAVYVFSLVFGTQGGWLARWRKRPVGAM